MKNTLHNTIGNYLGGLFVAAILTTLCVIGIAPNQANGALRAVAGGSGGGGVVPVASCSTQGGVVYNASQVFTCDGNLTYSTSGALVTVGSGTTTAAGVQAGYCGTSGQGCIARTGVTVSVNNSALSISSSATELNTDASTGQVYLAVAGGAKWGVNTAGGSSFDYSPVADNTYTLGTSSSRAKSAFLGSGGLSEQGTNVATAGATTINQATGSVTVASSASSVVVTNTTVASTDNIMATSQQNDTTCSVKNVVPGSGTFTINMTANCTANNRVGFFVVHLTN